MRSVIVTGGGRGIGAVTAAQFLALGERVYLADVGFDEAPPGAVQVRCDVSDPPAVERLVGDVLGASGRIDVLVNNAGIRVTGDVVQTSLEDWDRLMSVNLRAVFITCKHVLPPMLEAGSGAIVNVSSTAALSPMYDRAAYCTSKAAVIGLTRQMALQYAGRGVRVNAVCPGPTMTPHMRAQLARRPDPAAAEAAYAERQPVGRIGRPEEIAAAIVFLASESASFVTGSLLDVDGGATLVNALGVARSPSG